MSGTKKEAEHYDLDFGTNILQNGYGVVLLRSQDGHEKELFILEKNAGDLLLTTELRDSKGTLLAKIRRNSFVDISEDYDASKRFELGKRSRGTLILKDLTTGKEILNATIYANNSVKILGMFHTEHGSIEATENSLIINTGSVKNLHLSHNRVKGGYGMVIDEKSLSIEGSNKVPALMK